MISAQMLFRTRLNESRGCLNDFRMNKSDIDFAIRASFICDPCKTAFADTQPSKTSRSIARQIGTLLADISSAARAGLSVVDYWSRQTTADSDEFDVFLCHNSIDKPEIRKIAARLKRRGLRPWLDEEQLRPGTRWQRVLQDQISALRIRRLCRGGTGYWLPTFSFASSSRSAFLPGHVTVPHNARTKERKQKRGPMRI